MDPITTAAGVFAFGFGTYTSVLRVTHPAKLGKLQPMRDKFGHGLGTTIHLAAYSLAPIAAGVVFIVAGLAGVSFL